MAMTGFLPRLGHAFLVVRVDAAVDQEQRRNKGTKAKFGHGTAERQDTTT
jgi:hypothetical protein